MRRRDTVMLAVAFLLVPALVLGIGAPAGFLPEASLFDGGLLAEADAYIAAHLPGRETLAGWGLAIRVLGGQREYNQIFIFGDELIPIPPPPLDYQVRDNTAAILQFAEQAGVPVYAMIIPTVSAIRQQSLPPFMLGQSVNQRQFIDDVYADLIGRVIVVDAYNALESVSDQYIFYRTENNLTALGGFYLYQALGERLLVGIAQPNLQNYDIEFVKFDFLGNLYRRSPFQNARADILSIFRYRRVPPLEYVMTVERGGLSRTYHTIFPLHMLDLEEGRAMDIYLGGLSAITTIATSSPYPNSLLVLGDQTALAFVPFLANHYRTLTLLNLEQMGREEQLRISQGIRRGEFDQILFAYSVETYMHMPFPAWSIGLLPEPIEYDNGQLTVLQ